MEKLKVTLSFLISDDIQKVDITVADTNSDKKIHKVYDLLPGYHLENYVKLSYTQFQMIYGTEENSSQENENN